MKIKSLLYWPALWLVARFLRWHTNMVIGKAVNNISCATEQEVKFIVVAWGSSSLYQACRAFNHSIMREKNRREERMHNEGFEKGIFLRLVVYWRSYPER